MRRRSLIVLLGPGLFLVALSACTTVPSPDADDALDETAYDNYRVAYQTCQSFDQELVEGLDLEALADDLGVEGTDARRLARAFSDRYDDEFADETFNGCLDALNGEPMER